MITFTPTHGPAHEAWAAYDVASYDGPDSPRGTGQTRFEALAELVEQGPDWLLHKLHSGCEHSPPDWFASHFVGERAKARAEELCRRLNVAKAA